MPPRTQAPLLWRLRLRQRGVGLRLPAVRRLLACAQGAPGSGPVLRARKAAQPPVCLPMGCYSFVQAPVTPTALAGSDELSQRAIVYKQWCMLHLDLYLRMWACCAIPSCPPSPVAWLCSPSCRPLVCGPCAAVAVPDLRQQGRVGAVRHVHRTRDERAGAPRAPAKDLAHMLEVLWLPGPWLARPLRLYAGVDA